MRTQRETDLEDEIELLRGQLLSSYARIDELEASRKSDCVDFFRWWWNELGSNTDDGYDQWLSIKALEGEQ